MNAHDLILAACEQFPMQTDKDWYHEGSADFVTYKAGCKDFVAMLSGPPGNFGKNSFGNCLADTENHDYTTDILCHNDCVCDKNQDNVHVPVFPTRQYADTSTQLKIPGPLAAKPCLEGIQKGGKVITDGNPNPMEATYKPCVDSYNAHYNVGEYNKQSICQLTNAISACMQEWTSSEKGGSCPDSLYQQQKCWDESKLFAETPMECCNLRPRTLEIN